MLSSNETLAAYPRCLTRILVRECPVRDGGGLGRKPGEQFKGG